MLVMTFPLRFECRKLSGSSLTYETLRLQMGLLNWMHVNISHILKSFVCSYAHYSPHTKCFTPANSDYIIKIQTITVGYTNSWLCSLQAYMTTSYIRACLSVFTAVY